MPKLIVIGQYMSRL